MRKLLLVYFALGAVAPSVVYCQIGNIVVTNAASFQPGMPQSFSISTIFCTGLNVQGIMSAQTFPLPYNLAGVTVTVNGAAAPLFAVANLGSYQQVNFQVPLEGATGSDVVVVSQNGVQGSAIVPGNPDNEGDFFMLPGTQFGIFQHSADWSVVTPANPAAAGETIIGYATGLPIPTPTVPLGQPAPSSPLSYVPQLNSTQRIGTLVTGSAQALLNSRGVVAGTLSGTDGTILMDGHVALILTTPLKGGRPQRSLWTAVTDSSGSFRFAGLEVGTYKLCAQLPGSGWLNPCEWGLNPPVVSLSATQPSATVRFVLNKGAVISIRVNDPGGFLSQNEGRTPGADLLVGVPNDASAFELARKVSENAQGRDLQLVVPFNVAAQLVVRSAFYQVAAGGVSLSSAGFIPIAVPQGQQPAAITLTIAGGGH